MKQPVGRPAKQEAKQEARQEAKQEARQATKPESTGAAKQDSRQQALFRLLLCALSGTLLFLACANFDIWPLAWCGIIPLLVATLDPRCRHPFLYGWVTGLFANGGGFYWINNLLMRFGHMPLIAALPLYLLLIAYQAIAFGLFAFALRRLRDQFPTLPISLLAPILMTALELVVPFLFPWYLAITQAWVRPVIQVADLTGPLGVTFLLVLANGALYDLLAARLAKRPLPYRQLFIAAFVVVLSLVYGQVRIYQVEARRAAAPKMKVGVVQANIGITEKFVPGLAEEQLALHQRLSAELVAKGAELIVWPESSYPFTFYRGQTHDYRDARAVQQGFHAPILFGALTRGNDSPYPFNTALMMDAAGEITGTFDKNFLLVFGEYIPFYEHLKWVQKIVPEASNFARGESVTTFQLGNWKIGPMICYEDIIPAFGNRLAAKGPNFLVNITNDAWFGATSEPWEHLALAVYRSVEHRLDLVRAVNTGVSTFVDATGRLHATGPAVDPGESPGENPDTKPVTLLDEVARLEPGGLYGTVGDLFGGLNLAALLALAAAALKRSGIPVQWRAVATGTGALAAMLLVGALAAGGSSRFTLALALFAHQKTLPIDADAAFTLGAWLLAIGLFGTVAMGAGLSRWSQESPKLEAALAAVITLLVPPLLFGRLEGETAALVFTALGGAGMAMVGVWLGRRRA